VSSVIRWAAKGEKIENSRIDDFMDEIIAVCHKHGLVISHEDHHGAFVIEMATEDGIDWLSHAHIGNTVKPTVK
jgi:hypothetical protein